MTRDAFKLDQAQRESVRSEVYRVRGELFEASESNDAPRALRAVKDAYRLIEKVQGAELLYLGGSDEGFVLPTTVKQLLSRYSGRCSVCDGPYRRGDMIYWDPSDRSVTCVRCGGCFFEAQGQCKP